MKENTDLIVPAIKELLENADVFEVWLFDESSPSTPRELNVKFESDYLGFSANRIAKNVDPSLRKRLIEAFFRDAEKGGDVARCFIPYHGIKANFENASVEIAICYLCSSFRAQISDRKFGAPFPDAESSETKKIFDEIIEKHTVDVR